MTSSSPMRRRHVPRLGVAMVAAIVAVSACSTASPTNTAPAATDPASTSPTPPPSPSLRAVAELGEHDIERSLDAGTYRIGAPFGVPTTITVPEGWELRNVDQGDITMGSGDTWIVIDIVENVFADPCESRGGPIDPPVSANIDAVVEALVSMKGFTAGPVSDVKLGSHRGKAFELTNSINTQNVDCYGVACSTSGRIAVASPSRRSAGCASRCTWWMSRAPRSSSTVAAAMSTPSPSRSGSARPPPGSLRRPRLRPRDLG